ncbi:MAG: chorismate mutase [Clostridia bacterium]|nr:chorismate mutase [Clostridia bacterium]
MDLSEVRQSIDQVDDEIKNLYLKRMELVSKVTQAKKQTGKSTFDPEREKNIILRVTEDVEPDKQVYLKRVFESLFETSKAYQTVNSEYTSPTVVKLKNAIADGFKPFPVRAKVACQGVEGANSGIAADKLFEIADITYFKNFEGVMNAVEKGFCKYGVLPIENSYAGSVNAVYDLMKEHKFYIVKSLRMPVYHNLIVNNGVKISDIKEIISHEQAINQCRKYLEKFPGVKITPVANTALASKMVKDSGRTDLGALSSRECAEYYGLKILDADIQDSNSNYTRFIVIAKDLELFDGAKKLSIMTTLPHTPGSLYKLLAKFYSLGINLTKLESRPMTGANFEFMFYFDFEGDIKSQAVLNLIAELDVGAEAFTFLGAYNEVL